jgi:SAM-dependent methyltransferase
LGAGKKHWDGWINVDAFRGLGHAELIADVRSLPLETGMAAQAVAIHVLEHLHRWEAVDVLREWARILQPGGQLVIEVPCMDKVYAYIRGLKAGQTQVSAQMTAWAFWGDPTYHDASMMHKWGYCLHELIELMQEAGLQGVQEAPTRYHLARRDMRITGRKPLSHLLGQRKDDV